jgi:long-chain acyl-CoA synthetase
LSEPVTLCDLFYRSVETYRKPEHLKYKQGGAWRAVSSEEFRRAVEELSLGLRALGVERGDRVALLSENRPEWAFADMATLTAGAVDVPIYPTLTSPQVLYILKDSEAKLAVVSTPAQAAKVMEVKSQAPALRHVIGMEPGAAFPPGVLTLEEVRAKGRTELAARPTAVRESAAQVRPEDLATIIYTSGTTGDPKGVMLTHSNIVFDVKASTAAFDGLDRNDVALSFLPLCHIFERTAEYLMLHHGVTIAYAEGVEQVVGNLAEVRPTVMCSVPRFYEKVHVRVREKVANDPAYRQRLFAWALKVGGEAFQHRVNRTSPGPALRLKHALADRLVFKKIRARVGGRIRVFVSGGAPLAKEVAEFFGAAGLLILEGYGLSETSPVIAVNIPDAMRPGTVGRPIPGVEVKIAPDGEILTRGPHVMKGYFRKPDATAAAIDPEGWFHTGDIGHLDPDGFLVITDRKKDLIVTSGGKKVAPQPIENRLKMNPLIGEVVIVGNRRNFPAALVVPNFEALEAWARQKGLDFKSREELINRPEVVTHYEQIIQEMTQDLAQFEKIKKIALLPSEFTLAAGELTPTLKVKRQVVEEKYKDVIDRLYGGAAA